MNRYRAIRSKMDRAPYNRFMRPIREREALDIPVERSRLATLPLFADPAMHPIVYTRDGITAAQVVASLDGPVGFDAEWAKLPRSLVETVATLQFADQQTCLVYQPDSEGVHPAIADWLEDSLVLKYGAGLENDRKKVLDSFGIRIEGCVELDDLAEAVDPSFAFWQPVGLERHAARYLERQLLKDSDVQRSDWHANPLSHAQIAYAGADACAAAAVARCLFAAARARSKVMVGWHEATVVYQV